MKKLLFLLLLPTLLAAQVSVVSITPAISTTEIDSIVVTIGSPTVTSATIPFSGITAGMQVQSARFPIGTTVVSNTGDSTLVLSNNALATVALDSLRFATFTSLAYSAGDAVGMAFKVPLQKIHNVIVEDDAKVITAIKLVFYRAAFTEVEDNSAYAPSDADAKNIIGYLSLATSEAFTNNTIITGAATTLPVSTGSNVVYCQLLCVGTPTFTAVNNLRINFIGE